MEQHTLKNVHKCLNTNVYSYFATYGGQSYNLNLNVVHFSTPGVIRHLWQLKTLVFLHWCLLCAIMSHIISEFVLKKSDTSGMHYKRATIVNYHHSISGL